MGYAQLKRETDDKLLDFWGMFRQTHIGFWWVSEIEQEYTLHSGVWTCRFWGSHLDFCESMYLR
jgi:hypothetical protein